MDEGRNAPAAKPTIKIDDFTKINIRIGTVTNAERVPSSNKMLKLVVDFGSEKRQILTGIGQHLEPDHFIGKQMPFILNLEPRKIMGLESQGMIIAADIAGKPVLLHPEKEVPGGTKVM